MIGMFQDCKSLASINLSNFSTNKVERMDYMFKNCKSLDSINLSYFNCGSIEHTNDMIEMFAGCSNLQINNVKYNDFKIRSQLILDLKI